MNFFHFIFIKITAFRSFLENWPEIGLQFLLCSWGSAALESLGYGAAGGEWEVWPRRNQKMQEQGTMWQVAVQKRGTWGGQEALSSSLTYKTRLYKDPSSLVPAWSEQFNIYSHILLSLLRIKVAQILSASITIYALKKREREKGGAFKIRTEKKRLKNHHISPLSSKWSEN